MPGAAVPLHCQEASGALENLAFSGGLEPFEGPSMSFWGWSGLISPHPTAAEETAEIARNGPVFGPTGFLKAPIRRFSSCQQLSTVLWAFDVTFPGLGLAKIQRASIHVRVNSDRFS